LPKTPTRKSLVFVGLEGVRANGMELANVYVNLGLL
jgi:hypothetical protein